MKTQWDGPLEEFPLDRYPDYEAGCPPRLLELHRRSYLEEYERVWGRPWGGLQGIGRLRDVALVKPTEREGNALWMNHPKYFMLRFADRIDVRRLMETHEAYAALLDGLGIRIHWMTIGDTMGAYGPMRKLFITGEAMVVRGGAILPHCGHGAFKRGLEREYQRFLTDIGCPILLTVHGMGVAEPFATFIPVAENVWIAGRSNSLNQEGIDQIVPVLMRHGGREVHVMDMPTVLDTFEAGGEFHLDMVLAPLTARKLLVCPRYIGWTTHQWLDDRGFELIEVPADEQHLAPANLVLVEPGKVIMHAAAVKTIRAVERAGVDVIPFDCTGLMMGGVNGPRCCTLYLYREPGPELDGA